MTDQALSRTSGPVVGTHGTRQLERLRRLARLLDNAVQLPGTRYRIGLDPIIGLIPGIGDVIGAIFSTIIVFQAARLGAPRSTLVRMLANVTGHGLTVAKMHRRSLERFPFDSVLLPYSYVQLRDERYAADFEALADTCADRGVAMQRIKAIHTRAVGRPRADRSDVVRAAARAERHRPGRALGARPAGRLPQHRRRRRAAAEGARRCEGFASRPTNETMYGSPRTGTSCRSSPSRVGAPTSCEERDSARPDGVTPEAFTAVTRPDWSRTKKPVLPRYGGVVQTMRSGMARPEEERNRRLLLQFGTQLGEHFRPVGHEQ